MKKNSGILTFFLSIFIFGFLIFKPAFSQDASLLPNAIQQFFDSNGNPLSGGKIYFYQVGTSTFKDVYNSSAATTPYTNPITLNAGGKPPGDSGIYGIGLYRQLVKDKNGNTIWDAVTAPGGGGGGTPSSVGDGNAVGTVLPWSALTAPDQYVFTYGQELVRTDYPEFYSAITLQTNVICTSSSNTLTGIADTTQIPVGAPVELALCVPPGSTVISKTSGTVTLNNPANVSLNATARFFPYGNGNGSTTFNVPDLRDMTLIGRPNMGGTDRGLITSQYFGVNPVGLGAVGGSQNHTQTISEMAIHTHSNTLTDPGHDHGIPGYFDETSNDFIAAGGVTQIVIAKTMTAATGISLNNVSAGASDPFTIIQPSITFNYIIKVIPDTPMSTETVVTKLGGMTGVISCGTGLTCVDQTVSVNSFGEATTAIKIPVKAATTGNIGLFGAQTIDGISVVAGDRVLVKDQSAASENGIYVASNSNWTRATDFNEDGEVVQGTQVYVNQGFTNSNSIYQLNTATPIVIGSTALNFRLVTNFIPKVSSLSDLSNYYNQIGYVYLTQSNRNGLFIWDGSDLSAKVAIDTTQGIYVAPSTDLTGANGAWVRQISDNVSKGIWFGILPDASQVTKSSVVTITNTNPGVITWENHGLSAGNIVTFTTTGSLPTNIIKGTQYYILSSGLTIDTFQISLSPGGTPVDTTGSQSGIQTASNTKWQGTDNSAVAKVWENVSDSLGYERRWPCGYSVITDQITRNDTLGLQLSSNVTISGEPNGCSHVVVLMDASNSNTALYRYTGITDNDNNSTVYPTSPISQNNLTVTLNDTSSLYKDEYIQFIDHSQLITDNNTGATVARVGFLAKILSIDSPTQITLYDQAEFNLTANPSNPSASTTVRRFSAPATGLVFKDLTFDFDPNVTYTSTNFIFQSRRALYTKVLNINMNNSQWTQVAFNDTIGPTVNGGTNIQQQVVPAGALIQWPMFKMTGAHYGSISNLSVFGGVQITDGSASTTDGIEASHFLISNNRAFGMSGQPFQTHAGTRNWQFDNNLCTGGGSSDNSNACYQMRGRWGKVTNGKSWGVYTCYYDVFGSNNSVDGLDCIGAVNALTLNKVYNANIKNVNITNASARAIYVNRANIPTTFDNNQFENITIQGANPTTDIEIVGTIGNNWLFKNIRHVDGTDLVTINTPTVQSTGICSTTGYVFCQSGNVLFSGNVNIASTSSLSWNNDTVLTRGLSAGTLTLSNSTNPTSFQIYNSVDTPTNPINYERGSINFNSNIFTIGTEAGGTGSIRNLQLNIGGVNKLDYGITNPNIWTSSVALIVNGTITSGGSGFISPASGNLTFTGRGILASSSANQLQIGANGASPASGIFGASNARAGTDNNTAGGNLTIQSGTGTGTGTASSLILRSPITVGSGTSAQTQTTGLIITNGTAVTTEYTVSGLSSIIATRGARAHVTDATSCTFLSTLTGGGSTVCPVFYNGSAWVGG